MCKVECKNGKTLHSLWHTLGRTEGQHLQLLVNSTPPERALEPVTVAVLEDSVYQVSAIREGVGIVGSG